MTPQSISLNDLNQTLMQFGQNIGLGSFALDENRAASLIFDDRFLVELQALDFEANHVRTLYFIAVLCATPSHKNKDEALNFYQQLLQNNLSGNMMHGISFAFDKEHNEILLLRTLSPAQLNLEIIESEMERFVNVLEQWSTRLHNGVLDWKNLDKKSAKSNKQLNGAISDDLGGNNLGGGVRV